MAPVKLLLDAGADPNVNDEFGNDIVKGAMSPDVRKLLSSVTGAPVPPPQSPRREPVKMTAIQWQRAKKRIDSAFDRLSEAGVLTLHDAGQTQEDGFSDCSEAFRANGGKKAGIHGFCFYTRQDLNRAKRTGELSLAFWGTPKGAPKDMKRVGELIVAAFRESGCLIEWNGSASTRPTVYLSEL